MLAGLGAAVIPLVLHLLSRARYRSYDWSAMMFLPGADVRQQRSARLKQWLLLMLRTTMIALLAMAVARPKGAMILGTLGTPGEASVVIIVDRSASMGFDEGGRTRMAMAADIVQEILRNLRAGDRVMLLSAGEGHGSPGGRIPADTSAGALSPSSGEAPAFSSDLRALEAKSGELKSGWGAANLRDGLLAALDHLDKARDSRRQIYVVCDRQALSWRQVDDAFAATWRSRTADSQNPVSVFVVPVGTEDRENVAVESVELVNEPAVRGELAEVQITLKNYGGEPRRGLTLQTSVGGRESAPTTVDLAAGETQTVRSVIRFAEAGSTVISATIKSGSLAWDNTARTEVSVMDPLPVLILSGDERGRLAESESGYLKAALAPFMALGGAGGRGRGGDLAKVEVRTAALWTEDDLARYRAVILANVPQVTAEQARWLERYVWGGGGVVIACGSLVREENYNALLFRGGVGVLPATLGPEQDVAESTWITSAKTAHPIFRFLRGSPEGLGAGAIWKYTRTTPSSDGRVLASYADGAPAIIERSLGRGRVLLLTTAVDQEWTSLPLSNSYLPLMQSAVRYVSGGSVQDRNLQVGEDIVATVDDPGGTTVLTPNGTRVPVTPTRIGERYEIHYGPVSEPGVYKVQPKSPTDKPVNFVVHPPAGESDLTPLRQDQWEKLADKTGLKILEGRREAAATVVSAQREASELWPLFIGLVMLVGLVEMTVARRWSESEVRGQKSEVRS